MARVHELHRGRMTGDDLAKIDVSQSALVIDNRIQSVYVAEAADDLKLLLVKRVADQVALHSERVFHEARGVKGTNGFVVSDAGSDDLAAA